VINFTSEGIAPTYNLRRGVDVAAKINVTHIMPRKANMAADKHPDFHPNLPRIFFSKIGNQTLRTAIWTGTDKGYGKRTPLLFFNGIGANLEIAQAFADTFTGRDIITFDMPGVGGSPDPQIPYRPWWVAYAAKEILLCATTTGVTMVPGNPKALSKMLSPKRYIDRDFLAKNFETLYGDTASEGVHDFSVNMVPPSMKGYLYQLTAMFGYSTLPFIRRIKAKTLVIMGGNDHIVPVANGHILNYALKNSTLKVLDGAGHLFLLTRRDETVEMIRDFFGEPEVAMPHVEPVMLPSVAASYNHKDEFDPAFVKSDI